MKYLVLLMGIFFSISAFSQESAQITECMGLKKARFTNCKLVRGTTSVPKDIEILFWEKARPALAPVYDIKWNYSEESRSRRVVADNSEIYLDTHSRDTGEKLDEFYMARCVGKKLVTHYFFVPHSDPYKPASSYQETYFITDNNRLSVEQYYVGNNPTVLKHNFVFECE